MRVFDLASESLGVLKSRMNFEHVRFFYLNDFYLDFYPINVSIVFAGITQRYRPFRRLDKENRCVFAFSQILSTIEVCYVLFTSREAARS